MDTESAPERILTGTQRQRVKNTAQYVADHPGALVVRTTVGPVFTGGWSAAISGFGMFFNSPRHGHLVADAIGIRMLQGRKDAEWDYPWIEVTTLERFERYLKIEVVPWYVPKLYFLCEPNGDPLPASKVADIVIELQALAATARSAARE